ncbi:hypothetical protein GM658_26285 [Pseudoduganella eburnea]|uniref:Secreted protein n=2 Tax=Massilia eburnea TaxID=1776165 RepID=A0A6L6QNY5_9BURK|nr:hypothetical protein [Massilia eburnea]
MLPPRLGCALIALAAQLFGADTLVSYVNPRHGHALRLNGGAGLQLAARSDKPGEQCFRTRLDALVSTPFYRRCTRGLQIRLTQ